MNEKGVWGETQAAAYLEKQGYQIIARNYRTRFGEIDIIAQNESYLVFAEVKARRSAAFAEAREFVTKAKQNRLQLTAESWLSLHETTKQPRFDVIEVYGEEGGASKIHQIQNAF